MKNVKNCLLKGDRILFDVFVWWQRLKTNDKSSSEKICLMIKNDWWMLNHETEKITRACWPGLSETCRTGTSCLTSASPSWSSACSRMEDLEDFLTQFPFLIPWVPGLDPRSCFAPRKRVFCVCDSLYTPAAMLKRKWKQEKINLKFLWFVQWKFELWAVSPYLSWIFLSFFSLLSILISLKPFSELQVGAKINKTKFEGGSSDLKIRSEIDSG